MRLLLAMIFSSAGISLIGVILLIGGAGLWAVALMLLSLQVLVSGSTVVLFRLILRSSRNRASTAGSELHPGASAEVVVQAIRVEFATHLENQDRLREYFNERDQARSELRRELFEAEFGPQFDTSRDSS